MQTHHNEKMNYSIIQPILCVASKFICNIRLSNSLVVEKMVNY